MRKVLLRGRVLLLVLFVVALTAGCGHIRRTGDRASLCPGGSGSIDKGHPLICIGDDLSADPERIIVWDRQKQPDGNPSTFPVTLVWATRSGRGNLGIEFRETACIEPNTLRCNGHGKCVAQTARVEKGEVSCKYKITLDGKERDPEVVVQPCCM